MVSASDSKKGNIISSPDSQKGKIISKNRLKLEKKRISETVTIPIEYLVS